jgi:hypothetical protein
MNEKYWAEEDKRLERLELAYDMIEDAELMQEFDDVVWVSVAKALWNEYNGNDQGEVK